MTIVTLGTGSPLFTITANAQSIMDQVARDVRQTLSSTSSPDKTILLDYTNRVSQEMLKISKWIFLLSAPQDFVTQTGITNYWVGPTGQAPAGVYDTGLNLVDLRIVKPKSVIDRSNFRYLGHTDESPVSARLSFSDNSSRPGRPAVWRQDESTPSILNLYPAPDNQNNYSPSPTAPICGTIVGGALPARIYFVTVTFVDSLGNESTPPLATQIFVPANSLLQVFPPQEPLIAGSSGIRYDRYNVYASSAGTNEKNIIYFGNTIQQATLISTNYPWFEPPSGLLTVGPNPPVTNNIQPINGYIIEFRYYRQQAQLVDPNQVIQIPDDYKHTLVAGVNALAFTYLTRPSEAQRWYSIYQDGLIKIVRDLNFMAKGPEYIAADPASIGHYLPSVESIDLSVLIS